MVRYCNSCGKRVDSDKLNFCTGCGSKLAVGPGGYVSPHSGAQGKEGEQEAKRGGGKWALFFLGLIILGSTKAMPAGLAVFLFIAGLMAYSLTEFRGWRKLVFPGLFFGFIMFGFYVGSVQQSEMAPISVPTRGSGDCSPKAFIDDPQGGALMLLSWGVYPNGQVFAGLMNTWPYDVSIMQADGSTAIIGPGGANERVLLNALIRPGQEGECYSESLPIEYTDTYSGTVHSGKMFVSGQYGMIHGGGMPYEVL